MHTVLLAGWVTMLFFSTFPIRNSALIFNGELLSLHGRGCPRLFSANHIGDADLIRVSNMNLVDFPQVFSMCMDQFSPECKSNGDAIALTMKIGLLFVPKLLLPNVMGHQIFCLKENADNIIAFVDLSLQTTDGSLDTLKRTTLRYRQQKYKNSLEPYVCNLLVKPTHRKRGMATMIISHCETVAASWGHSYLNLHVERDEMAALSLYLKAGFLPQKTNDPAVFFMRKKIPRLPTI